MLLTLVSILLHLSEQHRPATSRHPRQPSPVSHVDQLSTVRRPTSGPQLGRKAAIHVRPIRPSVKVVVLASATRVRLSSRVLARALTRPTGFGGATLTDTYTDAALRSCPRQCPARALQSIFQRDGDEPCTDQYPRGASAATKESGDCVDCPSNSDSNQSSFTCTCNAGYSRLTTNPSGQTQTCVLSPSLGSKRVRIRGREKRRRRALKRYRQA